MAYRAKKLLNWSIFSDFIREAGRRGGGCKREKMLSLQKNHFQMIDYCFPVKIVSVWFIPWYVTCINATLLYFALHSIHFHHCMCELCQSIVSTVHVAGRGGVNHHHPLHPNPTPPLTPLLPPPTPKKSNSPSRIVRNKIYIKLRENV